MRTSSFASACLQALRGKVMQHPKRSETQAASEELDRDIAAIIADDKAAAHALQVNGFACLHVN